MEQAEAAGGIRPVAIDAARQRAALETYAQNEASLRRTARRYSLCQDDAEDALQRGLEILLRKAPSQDPRELVRWMQTVVKREAMALRRERERTLAGPAAIKPEQGMEDWVALLPATSQGPSEQAERREEMARSREALQTLKPHELRALTLLAEGYSYVEIGKLTGFSQTKVNRSLAEGRERFRRMVARSESGGRCGEMKPLISTFCDGEAKPREVAELREHLRACAHCRATLRAYRAAPSAAAALAPLLPLHRSLWERAREALGELGNRFGGETVAGTTAGGGAGGIGVAGVAKVAAICVATAGGAAACVAGGVVPSPLPGEHEHQARVERSAETEAVATEAAKRLAATAEVGSEPAAPTPEEKPDPQPKPAPDQQPAKSEPAPEPVPVAVNETEESEPPPEPEPAPASNPGGGSPAGEFGP
jgi:RNA polymerase sigma factor (sigma-70 family)